MSYADALARLHSDAAASAPELDWSKSRSSICVSEQIVSDDPEVKHTFDLPQVSYGEVAYGDGLQVKHKYDLPQVKYDDSPLESVDGFGKPPPYPPSAKRSNSSRKRFWIAVIVLLAIIAAAAVGIGLGVGLTRNKTETASAQPPSPTATSTPGSGDAPLKRGIANGSSVATAVGLDLTKHVFFQDINGNIRQLTEPGGGGVWDGSLDNIVATDARESTPLAAFTRIYGGRWELPGNIYLLYVQSNNTLAWTTYSAGAGWQAPEPMDFSKVGQFSLSPTSRNFAAAPIVDMEGGNNTNFGVLLMLHDASENLLVLYGFHDDGDTPSSIGSLVWNNVTDSFFSDPESAVTSAANCSFSNLAASNGSYYPFVACPPEQAKTDIGAWTFKQQPETQATTLPSFTVAEAFPVASKAAEPLAGDQSVAVSIGPNNTLSSDDTPPRVYTLSNNTLVLDTGVVDPKTIGHAFPFTNIAGAAPPGTASPYYYLYHQLNESAVAEETFNADTGVWSSTVLGVDTAT